ncbi:MULTISPECIES: SDR family NAD(P)-dependent oxidoreductase [unclassified Sphingobium]|uniref:SDR family NAD(P)-dependent oxidoreductase n=1 Tax=unclassified Sphingobium TaxID=2611147 RepID=UPI000D15A4A6|nr:MULTISPECIES: SDR family NAD(P)-dependent oxidoreductase [unclassified Sphingobium]MBG6120039.1 NAD(P)-dependent dehydrogenase (short-subunit alcohol dehydrogenase family) [Sphingobium sp. JAI105]PSO12905.1 hypothetical protein C7E20_03915 [Sphingobium sp. AEW4]TWD05760.1 NAD(P)-dependent dehydrogenase (short-subunit alcohol dehydrogenase family) [Sphingobium sp. AEW010]TWD23313.1 NAD(P)-dependent dehydrogenase (short-subunit alcohol dehydrogenase family) [Sphingobium sp. AEW013]TWD25173.1 
MQRVGIVFGGAGGIGAASARLIAADGAAIMVADRDGDGARAVADAIIAAGGQADFFACDGNDEAQIRALIDRTVARFGGIDILANILAMTGDGHANAGSIAEMTADAWDRTFAINLRAPMLAAKYAIPSMIARGGGSIVNISSTAAILSLGALPAYASSKAGLHALSRSIATEFGARRIRCNTVAPGFIKTPTTSRMSEEFFALTLKHNALPFIGAPEDIGHAVAFLASDKARYITGQLITVDGGQTTHLGIFADLAGRATDAAAHRDDVVPSPKGS